MKKSCPAYQSYPTRRGETIRLTGEIHISGCLNFTTTQGGGGGGGCLGYLGYLGYGASKADVKGAYAVNQSINLYFFIHTVKRIIS